MPDIYDKVIDGSGIGFLWSQIEANIDNEVAALATPLPIPIISVTVSGSSAVLHVQNGFTGYGDVTVRYKLGAEPGANDATIDLSNGTAVSAEGTYYVRAFPVSGSSYQPSAAAKVEVNI